MGYRRFRRRTCQREFNERTGTSFNHLQYPTDVVCLVVLWRVMALARSGVTVVVLDTLPPEVVTAGDEALVLAWRLRLLERRRQTRFVEEAGIPIVAWRGPGSLDPFLVAIARRSSAPRLARR